MWLQIVQAWRRQSGPRPVVAIIAPSGPSPGLGLIDPPSGGLPPHLYCYGAGGLDLERHRYALTVWWGRGTGWVGWEGVGSWKREGGREERWRRLHGYKSQPTRSEHAACIIKRDVMDSAHIHIHTHESTCCCCVLKLCTVINTLRWAVLTVLWIGFCHTGPISSDLFVFICVYFVCFCFILHSCCIIVSRWGGPDGIEV